MTNTLLIAFSQGYNLNPAAGYPQQHPPYPPQNQAYPQVVAFSNQAYPPPNSAYSTT